MRWSHGSATIIAWSTWGSPSRAPQVRMEYRFSLSLYYLPSKPAGSDLDQPLLYTLSTPQVLLPCQRPPVQRALCTAPTTSPTPIRALAPAGDGGACPCIRHFRLSEETLVVKRSRTDKDSRDHCDGTIRQPFFIEDKSEAFAEDLENIDPASVVDDVRCLINISNGLLIFVSNKKLFF
jgi:hypothetical protein